MEYRPKILYNPKDRVVEVMWAHQTFTFEPGEKKQVPGHVARHALLDVNTGLKEYEPDEEGNMPETQSSGVAYDKMEWKRLVSLGSKEGVFKPGMKKAELIRKLTEADGQEA